MVPRPRRTTLAHWLAAGFVASALVPLAGACGVSTDDAPPLGGTPGAGRDATSGVVCSDGVEGCPCATPGQSVSCGKIIQEYADYVQCGEGQSTCSDGSWGPCQLSSTSISRNRTAVTIADPLVPAVDPRRLASMPVSCTAPDGGGANPCDINAGCTVTPDGPGDVGGDAGLSLTEAGISIPGTIYYEGGTGDAHATCTGLQCQVQYCGAGNPNGTTITGKVFDPAGNNPLYNAWVYIPLDPTAALPAFPSGAQCSTCAGAPSLNAVAVAQTAPDGTFTLTNVPVGTNIPIVVQMGKWRREIQIPTVNACTNNAIGNGTLRLPRNHTDGLNNYADMPQVAFVSGSADPFECMLLKAGIDPNEFGSSTLNSTRKFHYYQSPDSAGASIDPSFGNVVLGSALWGNSNSSWPLSNYDVVIFACEGGEYNLVDRNPTGYSNLVSYANAGGRVFLSHYSYVWMKYNNPWKGVASAWGGTSTLDTQDPLYATIVTSGFPKGQAFQTWLSDIGDLPGSELTIHQGRQDFSAVSSTFSSPAQPWMSATDTAGSINGVSTYPPTFTFNTPVTATAANQCGRVVFSDYHVSTSAQVPTNGNSVSCGSNTDCGYGSTCPAGGVTGSCSALSCGTNSPCPDSNWTCQGATNSCARNGCTLGGQCTSGRCSGGVCGCASSTDCGTGGYCNTSNHTCTTLPSTCNTAADCGGSGNASCISSGGTCVANSCTNVTQCSATSFGGQERCVGGTCNGCLNSDDCPGSSLCSVTTSKTCVNGSGTSVNGNNFPYECIQAPLSPQEAALEFEFFDLSACVSPDGVTPQGPPAPTIIYNPVTFTVDYQSSCPAGTGVAWRQISWQANIPATASIVFSAQTANPAADGGIPNYTGVQSVTVATATSANQSSSALIDVVPADGGVGGAFESASPPVASQGDLRLTITLNPTTSMSAPPTLITWQVQSDCPANQ